MVDICFFPFTHISADQRRILGSFFSKVRVLSLDQRDAEALPEPFSPFCVDVGTADLLKKKEADYKAWAGLHRGNERNLKQLIRQTPYFRTDNDLTHIRSQIRGDHAARPELETGRFDPGLFLKLAQTLDLEQESIKTQLSSADLHRAALFSELKGVTGDDEDFQGGGQDRDDPGQTLPGERVAAWAQVAASTGLLKWQETLLVTTSAAVVDYLKAEVTEVENGLDIDTIKVHESGCGNKAEWLQSLEDTLDRIVSGGRLSQGGMPAKDPGCCAPTGRLNTWLFPGGELNQRFKIPGRRIMVCLVGLNS